MVPGNGTDNGGFSRHDTGAATIIGNHTGTGAFYVHCTGPLHSLGTVPSPVRSMGTVT